ncbi:nitrous oxide reductase family maturation protein NosD [Natrinema altunense]|uniref:Parallel beta-helix repeat-containing protein n=1 Tax=Natrinema altunense (strain JCM 12890 / CGMCC 1.3731 / AJ2) TaxID=1227494 RepID=L9ZCR0_NATA2|nr:nitrous oxide reductase family maturation protein NosD [Natrinema altunense]ELY84265.1 parallel beta-helix repeat-containing protein [Natrinema altunense JCM 12890]
MKEGTFAVAAAIVLVCSLAGAAVAATGNSDNPGSVAGWQTDVPAVHDVSEPQSDGVATVDDRTFDSVQRAVDAADPGDTVRLEGRFDERVTVDTPAVTIAAADRDGAVIDGGGEGQVLVIEAENVTLENVWIRNSGTDRQDTDSGIVVNGSNATLSALRLTEIQFGIWIGSVDDVTVEDSIVAGREDVPLAQRGNGIHLWEATDAEVRNNSITTVRDGIYFQWAEGVVAEGNTMWNMRYGVHYMYSNENSLENNVAFDNDVGFALMVSEELTLLNNTAVNNDGTSGHGILVKDVENSRIAGNDLVGNGNGLYIHNSQDNRLESNLLLENDVGIHITAGSSVEHVSGNSFIRNAQAAFAETNSQAHWNATERGNYWSGARVADLDGDGISENRHRPAGTVERLIHEKPQAAVFAESPAFDAVTLAESSFPVLETPGIIDNRPLADSPHDNWRTYYADHDH